MLLYLNYLSEEDLFDNLIPYDESHVLKNISKLIPLEYTLTTSLEESRKLNSLRTQNKLHFCLNNGHVSEIEILVDESTYTREYQTALLGLLGLKQLKEVAIYNLAGQIPNYEKSLTNSEDIKRELTFFDI